MENNSSCIKAECCHNCKESHCVGYNLLWCDHTNDYTSPFYTCYNFEMEVEIKC